MEKICPDEERLADYLEKRLSDEERSLVEAHLSVCESCLDLLVAAQTHVRAAAQSELAPVPEHVTESAIRAVGRLHPRPSVSILQSLKKSIGELLSRVADYLGPRPQPVPIPYPVRGPGKAKSKEVTRVQRTFDGVELEIEIDWLESGEANILVEVRDPQKLRESVRVTLMRSEREIASHLLDQGHVLIEDLPPGRYSLVFLREGVEIGTYVLEFGETDHE